jgi:8-oxo-dGTP pyrophosphatase MutT (NUDIX family)
MKTFLLKGNWEHSEFEAYLDIDGNFESLRQTTTAVVSVCFTRDNKVVLTHRKDGMFDLLGGKTKSEESVEDTLSREALEEGGMKLLSWKYFGHYRIKLLPDAPKRYKDKYPKISHILFFISQGEKVCVPFGKEIQGSREFSIEELKNSNILDHVMLKEAIKMVGNKY